MVPIQIIPELSLYKLITELLRKLFGTPITAYDNYDFAPDIYVGDKKFPQDRVLGALNKEMAKTRDKTLFLRADYDIPYGKVAKLMSFLKRGGISIIALVTELEKS